MRLRTQNPSVIRFENYELDLAAEELRKQGSSLKLQPQPFKILAYLASRPGELITRQELRDHVWPGDTFVDFDLAINQAIKQIGQFSTMTQSVRGSSQPCHAADIGSLRRLCQGQLRKPRYPRFQAKDRKKAPRIRR